jgi:hypothetical protein
MAVNHAFALTEHDDSDGSVRIRVVGQFDAATAPAVQDAFRRL